MDIGKQLEQTREDLKQMSVAERPFSNTGRPILDITSGISTLQAVLIQVQDVVQYFTDLEDTLDQLSQSRSSKRDRAAQMSHIAEVIEHINAMDGQFTAEGHSVFGETEDAPIVSLPDGSSVCLRPNRIHPSLSDIECQTPKDIATYLDAVKVQLQDIRAWQTYLMGQLDALVQKLPFQRHRSGLASQSASPHEAKAEARDAAAALTNGLLVSDVLSLTHLGQLKGDRVAALLDDPTVSHPAPCHLAVKTYSLNVH